MKNHYAIVDIETTGGAAAQGGITEVAVYIHDGNRVIDHFTSLVNPGMPVPAYITALTGINNAMLASAPYFDEIAAALFDILDGKIFVAHNVNFDYSFLKQQFKMSGYNLVVRKLCTVRLSRKIFPGYRSYSLGTLCRNLNIPLENRHRADGDAAATVLLLEKILAENGTEWIDQMLKKSSGEQWLPLHLDKKEIDSLPTGPGVYYFHNLEGKIIYVGKAINIRKRVSSHFTKHDAALRRQYFLRTIKHIAYQECNSELHALVLESAEIKRLWPKYNFSQKEPLQKYAMYQYEDNRGYIRLLIDKKKKNVPELYSFNLYLDGLNIMQKMIREYELDARLCFLDKTSIPKEDFKIIGSPKAYNEKVQAALHALKDVLPSFAVVDKNHASGESLCILIDRGSFWGMGYVATQKRNWAIEELKNILEPHRDNNFIRNAIFNYVEQNPHKRINF